MLAAAMVKWAAFIKTAAMRVASPGSMPFSNRAVSTPLK